MIVREDLVSQIKRGVIDFFDEIIPVQEFTIDGIIQLIKSTTPKIDYKQTTILPTKEISMMLAEKIREILGLPGDLPDYILRFTDKKEMKKCLVNTDVNFARYFRYYKNDHLIHKKPLQL